MRVRDDRLGRRYRREPLAKVATTTRTLDDLLTPLDGGPRRAGRHAMDDVVPIEHFTTAATTTYESPQSSRG